MRQKIFWLFLGLSFSLWGCNRAPEARPVAIVSETSATRTIAHTFGTTEIPKTPERIIALGEEGLLVDLLDLGIQPVGSTVNLPDHLPLFTAEELDGIEQLISSTSVSMESLVALNPDLIIGTVFFINEIGFGQLSEIAPTIAVRGSDPLGTYLEAASVFGLREQAEQEVAQFREEIAGVAEELHPRQLEVTVATIYPGPSVALWFGGVQPGPEMLNQLGVTLLPTGAAREELDIRNGRVFISDERYDLIMGEPLILLQNSYVEGEMDAMAEMEANALWQQLPAMQSGNVITLDRLGYPGFRGQIALLADLREALK
ncbi:MAG: ABC transporter substrate-binding protein [Anaerolineales bacterium]